MNEATLSVKYELVSKSIYNRYLKLFPKVAIDIVALNELNEFALVKRNGKNNEWSGSWATPGGRVFRNEKVSAAAHRILKRETGLSVPPRKFEFRGFEEVITPLEHAVTLIFRTRTHKTKLVPDETSSEAKWFKKVNTPRNLRHLYRNILTKCSTDF